MILIQFKYFTLCHVCNTLNNKIDNSKTKSYLIRVSFRFEILMHTYLEKASVFT